MRLLAILMAAACLLGLTVPGIYRDNAAVTWGWFGNDWVTLLAAVPTLLFLAWRTGRRSQLLKLGLTYFAFYNYLFYLLGAAFNRLFLLYAAIVVWSGILLLRAVRDPDVSRWAVALPRLAFLWVTGYLVLVGVMMATVHVSAAAAFVLYGQLPGILVTTGHPTNVVAALDLSLVVTPALLGAWWLWRGRPDGFLLAVLVNVKGAFYMLALTAATLFAAGAGTGVAATEAILWAGLGIGCGASVIVLLRGPGARHKEEDNRHVLDSAVGSHG